MLSSLRYGVDLIGGHHLRSRMLARVTDIIMLHDSKRAINRAQVNYYHCTQPAHGQSEGSTTIDTHRETLSKARLEALNKVKDTQIVYKPISLTTMITLSRAAMAPLLGYFIFSGMYPEAIYCMTYVVASDIVDKVVAVKTKQASPANAILDHISDKLVTSTAIIAMYNMSILPIWAVKGFVFKDISTILIGGMMRYYGFSESPSLKKFLDFNNHPTLGFNPSIIERVHTGAIYTLIMIHLALPESLRNEYFYSMATYQGFSLTLTCVVMASRQVHLLEHRFLSRKR